MTQETPTPSCNICGSKLFRDAKWTTNSICVECGSSERVRVTKLFLDRHGLPEPGMRVAHFAPEECLARYLHGIVGDGYEPYDLDAKRYGFVETKAFNLCADVYDLASDHFDIIIHNHVIEHLPCNYTMSLLHLHRSLKPGGRHLFSMPVHEGSYEEDLSKLSGAERKRRFNQNDHVRRFGRSTIDTTIGMLFRIKSPYRLIDQFPVEALQSANIQTGRDMHHGTSVMCFAKEDVRI